MYVQYVTMRATGRGAGCVLGPENDSPRGGSRRPCGCLPGLVTEGAMSAATGSGSGP